jgi:hypothetical protein
MLPRKLHEGEVAPPAQLQVVAQHEHPGPRAPRSHAAGVIAERVGCICWTRAVARPRATFACAELPRHSLDYDRGPGASEAGRFSLHQSPPSAELTLRRILWRPHSLVSQVLDSGEDVPELLRREWESDESGKSRW